MTRRTRIERNTKETQISVDLDVDGTGQRTIQTPLPFLTHMLDAFARHGVFDLAVTAAGDIEIDGHHTVEDIGLVLGNAFEQALAVVVDRAHDRILADGGELEARGILVLERRRQA